MVYISFLISYGNEFEEVRRQFIIFKASINGWILKITFERRYGIFNQRSSKHLSMDEFWPCTFKLNIKKAYIMELQKKGAHTHEKHSSIHRKLGSSGKRSLHLPLLFYWFVQNNTGYNGSLWNSQYSTMTLLQFLVFIHLKNRLSHCLCINYR